MKKFCFYHPYHPMTWQAMIDRGLVREGDGVKFNQSLLIGGELILQSLRHGKPCHRDHRETVCRRARRRRGQLPFTQGRLFSPPDR